MGDIDPVAIDDVVRAVKNVSETAMWIFAEANSMSQYRRDFEHTQSIQSRRAFRAAAYRLSNELDQMQQHLDSLSQALSDYEVSDLLEESDHGYYQEEPF